MAVLPGSAAAVSLSRTEKLRRAAAALLGMKRSLKVTWLRGDLQAATIALRKLEQKPDWQSSCLEQSLGPRQDTLVRLHVDAFIRDLLMAAPALLLCL